MDPRWKLAALAISAALTAVRSELTILVAALALGAVLAAIARLSARWTARRVAVVMASLVPFMIILPLTVDPGGPGISIGGLDLSYKGLNAAIALSAKALAILILILIGMATTPPPRALRAVQDLRVPRLMLLLIALSYRYIFVLRDELQRLRTALRVRGFHNRSTLRSYQTSGHLSGTLIVRGLARAERVAQSMRSRGFDGTFRGLDEFHTRATDIILFVVVVGAYTSLVIGSAAADSN